MGTGKRIKWIRGSHFNASGSHDCALIMSHPPLSLCVLMLLLQTTAPYNFFRTYCWLVKKQGRYCEKFQTRIEVSSPHLTQCTPWGMMKVSRCKIFFLCFCPIKVAGGFMFSGCLAIYCPSVGPSIHQKAH